MTNKPEKINLSNVNSRKVDSNLLNELRDLFAKAEDQKERYDFTWNGKSKAYYEATTPTTKTLHPRLDESVDFENSENLFITGDNLETLKLLQESYLGKIDMIYIDPPYNTGNDFVYHDNFKKSSREADLADGSIDSEGNRLIKNDKSNGRYHSDWLTMMYPRLKLARNLLSEKGLIFVSIDDHEQANLRLLMDEIFGEENFITNFIWNSSTGGGIRSKHVNNSHQYIQLYAKNIDKVDTLFAPLSIDAIKLYKAKNEKGRYRNKDFAWKNSSKNKKQRYAIKAPDGEIIKPKDGYILRFINKRFQTELDQGNVTFKKTSKGPFIKLDGSQANWNIYIKKYLGNALGAPVSVLPKSDVGLNNDGTAEIQSLFGNRVFDFPKSTRLLKYILNIGTSKDSVILDFFAGSGTTADAVMQLNAEDKGSRKFIVATLDEQTPEKSEARKVGYNTIDQIARERIRRAAKKIGDTSGFRALEVADTGLKEDIFKTARELNQENILLDVDNQSDNRSDFDLLYDVLVDGALEYNRKIEFELMDNQKIIKYDYLGELSGVVAYFGNSLTEDLIRKIAGLKPLIVVFKESTFEKSAQKVNVLEQFRITSPETNVKVI